MISYRKNEIKSLHYNVLKPNNDKEINQLFLVAESKIQQRKGVPQGPFGQTGK